MILEHPGQTGSRIRLDRLEPEQGGSGRIGARAIAVEHDDASLADGETLVAAVGIEDDGVAIRLPRELTLRGGRCSAADQGASAEFETTVLAEREPHLGSGAVLAGHDALVHAAPVQGVPAVVHVDDVCLRGRLGLLARARAEQGDDEEQSGDSKRHEGLLSAAC